MVRYGAGRPTPTGGAVTTSSARVGAGDLRVAFLGHMDDYASVRFPESVRVESAAEAAADGRTGPGGPAPASPLLREPRESFEPLDPEAERAFRATVGRLFPTVRVSWTTATSRRAEACSASPRCAPRCGRRAGTARRCASSRAPARCATSYAP
ncbi:hypothetical protein NKH77_44325 [Streptomyces sp. M19]